jgi:Na+/H+-dicarboxylate symporter
MDRESRRMRESLSRAAGELETLANVTGDMAAAVIVARGAARPARAEPA